MRPEEADLLGAGRRMLVPELRRKERKEDEEWYRVSRFQLDWIFHCGVLLRSTVTILSSILRIFQNT